MNARAKDYYGHLKKWKDELLMLREIILSCGLEEEFKWKHPCFTYNGKNVVLIHEFKDYCGIMFFKGALLKDEKKVLHKIKNIQSERQFRFTNEEEITENQNLIRAYIFEAIEVEQKGLKVKMKDVTDYDVPKELHQKFIESPDFKTAFANLTPGRQKGYLLHFTQAKQSSTRTARIEKYEERIRKGKGIRDCICGRSKRMPNCDGSHKNHF
ncbi:MAG: DUF1801 domain-containing protein [bacterium]|nr:DUF1801 domain-containing protein [bacterium]